MTGASHGFSRAAAPVCGFSGYMMGSSGSLSCSAREVRPPCVWPGRSRHCYRVMGGTRASRGIYSGAQNLLSLSVSVSPPLSLLHSLPVSLSPLSPSPSHLKDEKCMPFPLHCGSRSRLSAFAQLLLAVKSFFDGGRRRGSPMFCRKFSTVKSL